MCITVKQYASEENCHTYSGEVQNIPEEILTWFVSKPFSCIDLFQFTQ